jgi:hypothetical protein
MSDLQQYVGSCLCGAVTYQIDGPIGDIIQCHCQKCRKANGTAYATNAPIAKADFKLTSGQDVVKKYASSAGTERCFCGICGSPLISIKAETPEGLAAGVEQVKKEVAIETQRAKMYALMGATDLSWRKRQSAPVAHRELNRPIFRGR